MFLFKYTVFRTFNVVKIAKAQGELHFYNLLVMPQS